MPNILIVDDDTSVRRVLSRQLGINGYICTQAADAAEARNYLKSQNFELILCDLNMPGEPGMDLIRYILSEYPDTAVVMVTGMDDAEIAETAFDLGAYGYIIKPFKANEVRINVSNALRRRDLEIDNRAHRQNLEQMVTERTDELQETLQKLRKTMEGIIQAMALTVERRDPYTAGHQRQVAALANAIALEMGFSEDQIDGIRLAGMIHDLGKIAVPVEILSKPGAINENEFGIIKSHPQIGYDILKEIEFPFSIAQIVLQHHERMDGSGYPLGLSGEAILQEARILGVADVVEAMASDRPYRPALGIEVALEEISRNRGALYDPEVADACLSSSGIKGSNLHKE